MNCWPWWCWRVQRLPWAGALVQNQRALCCTPGGHRVNRTVPHPVASPVSGPRSSAGWCCKGRTESQHLPARKEVHWTVLNGCMIQDSDWQSLIFKVQSPLRLQNLNLVQIWVILHCCKGETRSQYLPTWKEMYHTVNSHAHTPSSPTSSVPWNVCVRLVLTTRDVPWSVWS